MTTCQQTYIHMIPYSEELRADWDDFISNNSINSTFIHSRKFFDHNPLNMKDDSSLIFYKEKKIIAIFPAVSYIKDSKWILHSHLRATYGGFVVSEKVGIKEAMQIVELTIYFAKQKGIDQIIVRNPFRIFHSKLCDETDYAMWFHGFRIKSRELEVVVPLLQDVQESRSKYHQVCQRSIKKASKEVEIRLSDDFEEYWILLEKCLLERHDQRPVHDYKSICKLRGQVGEDKVLLFSAYYNNRLIGGVVVFVFEKLSIHSQYIASDFNFKHLCPIHAIVDYLIHWGSMRGAKYLNLGMANEAGGKKINFGLFRFKESFGGRGVLRETMYLNL